MLKICTVSDVLVVDSKAALLLSIALHRPDSKYWLCWTLPIGTNFVWPYITGIISFNQLFLKLDQSSAFLTLEMLSNTSNGVTFPITVTFCFGISMLNDVTPSIFEMCFLTLPAQPWQWRDTLSTTTSVASVADEQDGRVPLLGTGHSFTTFGSGDGWYGTIANWSMALQLKRLIEWQLLRCVDRLAFSTIPPPLWSALLARRSVLLLGFSPLICCSELVLLGSLAFLPSRSGDRDWLPFLTRDRRSRLGEVSIDAGEAHKISIPFILQGICTQMKETRSFNGKCNDSSFWWAIPVCVLW